MGDHVDANDLLGGGVMDEKDSFPLKKEIEPCDV
jgi:hypothetical protein